MATPTLTVDDIVVGEKDGLATFVLRLSQPSASATSVSYSLSPGTAGNSDFSAPPGGSATVTFAAGETTKSVSIAIVDDATVEGSEIFFLNLFGATGLTLGRNLAIATILDNDTTVAVPLVSVSDAVVNESDGTAGFVIRLDHASTTSITVTYQTKDGSALSGSDYAAVTSTVTFLPGETAKTILVPLVDDSVAEADETFGFQLTGATGGAILGDTQGTAIIEHNDGPVAVSPVLNVDDIVASEGDVLATFVLRLSQPSASVVGVSYSVSTGTAGGDDFIGPPGGMVTLTFAPGETVKLVNIPIVGDIAIEGDETFYLNLFGATGVTLGRDLAIATIVDNDTTGAAPLVSVSEAVVNESDGNAAFAITLDRASTTSITVTYQTKDGSALSGSDYAAVTSTVTFLPGETAKTVLVPLVDDSVAEADETFGFQLTGATGGAILGDTQGTAIIEHNDGPVAVSPVLNVDDIVVSEGDVLATFVLRLTQPSASVTSVSYSLSAGTAGGNDFVGPLTGTAVVNFAPGETVKLVNIPIVDDTAVEAIEIFSLKLSGAAGLTLGRAQAIATIVDNDTIGVAPLVSVSDAVVNESDGNAAFAITLDRASTTLITVTYQTKDGSALSGSDYVAATSTVTFLPGETAKTVLISLIDDNLGEADETFGFQLTGVTGGAILGDTQGTAIIEHNDGPAAVSPVLNVDDIVAGEGDAFATFVLRLSQPSASVTSVSYSLSAGTAFSGDFVVPPGGTATINFAPGETVKLVDIPIVDDIAIEGDETFYLNLFGATGVTLGRDLAIATIVDNDTIGAAPLVSVSDAVVNESDGNAGFAITLDRASTTLITVTYQTKDGSALSGSDYAAVASTVTFLPGETAKTVLVPLVDDSVVEADETFGFQLTGATGGAILGDTQGTAIIEHNDGPAAVSPVLNVDDVLSREGDVLATFVLRLSQPSASVTSVSYSLSTGTAGGNDFVGPPSGTAILNFAPGETVKLVNIPIVDDIAVEGIETFSLKLSGAAGLTLGRTQAAATIVDNDDLAVLVSGIDSLKAEGQGGNTPMTFSVSLEQALGTSQTLNWVVGGFGNHPASAADFTGGALPSGTVTFAPGETHKVVTVNVAGDTVFEADEAFVLKVTDPSGVLGAGTAQALGTIVNDDTAPPVATHADAYIVIQGHSLSIAASAGILLNDESASTATLLTGPAHGTLQLAAPGGFGYTPAGAFSGIDSFGYHATDGATSSDGQALLYVVPVIVGTTTTLNLLALSAEEQIAATYAAFFGRGADSDGFEFWVGQFNANLQTQGPAALFANIASSFGVSAEARTLYPFLVNPFGASDSQISAFIDSVYNNLFNRGSDAAGLAYWTGQVKATLAAGQFVGSVLINIMSGTQDTSDGHDITTLMGKVAVALAYVHQQEAHHTTWMGASDTAAATSLLQAVSSDPSTVLLGIKQADTLIAGHP